MLASTLMFAVVALHLCVAHSVLAAAAPLFQFVLCAFPSQCTGLLLKIFKKNMCIAILFQACAEL